MLELKQITKDYPAGAGIVHALKGVTLQFRDSEFVSILGPSGCGKTTLLNIVGGLDQYTEGDLVINGVSTKEYKDRDWDGYRNHSVGFVFQSYNLIPHQTVLQNVEIALTLSGVGKAERRQRAIKALEEVGLGDQLHKRPNAMSGGQMQRVAIARALVNNPEIILADEPTGALDTETSVQVMEILKEVSKDRLVVMVTHNPELAEKYSSRIIRMLDGNIIGDSAPLTAEEIETAHKIEEEKNVEFVTETVDGAPVKIKKKKEKKPTMSFFTAFRLSLKNLFTKKGRTTLTSFAGSIGIIGIALILAVSQGTTAYIDHVQETTLSSYPLTLEASTVDLTALMQSMMSVGSKREDHTDEEFIYKEPIITELVNALSEAGATENDLTSFKAWLEEKMADEDSKLHSAVSGVQYTYNFDLSVYTQNVDGNIIKSDTGELFMEMFNLFMAGSSFGSMGDMAQGGGSMFSTMMMGSGMWQELLPGKDGETINDFIYNQYDKIYGDWPNDYNEVVLVVNENNELDDLTLYALGLLTKEQIDEIVKSSVAGKPMDYDGQKWSFKEICERQYRVLLDCDFYEKVGEVFADKSEDKLYLENLYNNTQKALDLKVTGIIRPNKDAETHMLSGTIGYTYKLTQEVMKRTTQSPVVDAQLKNKDKNVLTGTPFESVTGTTSVSENTYDGNMQLFGYAQEDKPATINLYASSFKAKDVIKAEIERYNKIQETNGEENKMIEYTDYIGLMISSITTIINAITYVLIAFVAISLIVSSIMIGVITLISVQERTKEIGILRAIGASKNDVSSMFNAETLIIGFTSGLLGIAVTYILCVPINLILHLLTGIATLSAFLNPWSAVILVLISMGLTLISGLIPSRSAAKKDPVVALRTE